MSDFSEIGEIDVRIDFYGLGEALDSFSKALLSCLKNLDDAMVNITETLSQVKYLLKCIILQTNETLSNHHFYEYQNTCKPLFHSGECIRKRAPPRTSIKEKAEIYYFYLIFKYEKYIIKGINLIIINETYSILRLLFQIKFGF